MGAAQEASGHTTVNHRVAGERQVTAFCRLRESEFSVTHLGEPLFQHRNVFGKGEPNVGRRT